MSGCKLCNFYISSEDWFRETANDSVEIDCPRCGNITISRSLMGLPSFINDDTENKLLVSGICRQRYENSGERFQLNTYNYDEIIENNKFSNALELIDNLILYLGSKLKSPGSLHFVSYQRDFTVIGASSEEDMRFTALELMDSKMITTSASSSGFNINLRHKGWEAYRDISKNNKDSKIVFMAMQFQGDHLDEVFQTYKLAVSQTGFQLNRLDKEPKAGMILNHMRLAIQKSKFIIADITYKNNGAYWEAGYAEGLGKNVIYSCSTNRKAEDMHFDVNQLQTVFWDHSNLKESAEALKLIIRSTFSREAILED